MWYADGRSNSPNVGRHSLGTKAKSEAISRLAELDRSVAEDHGLIPRSVPVPQRSVVVSLADGRRLYEDYLKRPRATGGVKFSTQKRYRTVFDKFIPFAISIDIRNWNEVNAEVLNTYAAYLERSNYSHKTLVNELTTLKQAAKFLIDAGHLVDAIPIRLRVRKAESERAYCWKPLEVTAIIDHCHANMTLSWVGDVVVALACTGLRISELASLRWNDIELSRRQLRLTEESAHRDRPGIGKRSLKSGRSRSFPIHPDLIPILTRLPRKDVYVFRGPRGGRLKPDTVRNVLVQKVIDVLAPQFPSEVGAKGFANGRLHSFRHYFCSRCADSGVPERMIMDWLGHADSEMVRHYYHMNDDEAHRRMDGLDLLGETGKRTTG